MLESKRIRLKQLVELGTQKRYVPATSGKLDMTRLAFASLSDYIYLQPMPDTGKKYKADIILDVSGSMRYNDRMVGALHSVQNLIKLFHGIIDFRIICFGAGFYQTTANNVLSINSNDNYTIINKLDRGLTILNNELVIMEGGVERLHCGTHIASPLAASMNGLISAGDDCEKLIFLITDGDDYWDEFGGSTNNALSRFNKVNGIKLQDNYEEIIHNLKCNNINLLPIGINIDISRKFPNAINLNDSEKIFDETLTFIEKLTK